LGEIETARKYQQPREIVAVLRNLGRFTEMIRDMEPALASHSGSRKKWLCLPRVPCCRDSAIFPVVCVSNNFTVYANVALLNFTLY